MANSKSQPAMELTELAGLDTHSLRKRWFERYGLAPAPRISRDVLIRGVAFRMQVEAQGPLSKSCRRQLQRLAKSLRDSGSIPVSQRPAFKPGTKLIREWQGKVHEVVIAGDTYIWAGKHFRSLSQIARSITGTRWSGPRFFGLEGGQAAALPADATRVTMPARSVVGVGDG